tara:strand:+ start:4881 stop:5837 length:957 start_codon:yes stop_codon:yes gene_type:complete
MNKKKQAKEVYLVTGCSGFIGYHWTKYLLKKNKTVLGIDLKPFPDHTLKKNKNFSFYHKSIFDFNLVKKLLNKADIVCHFAGIAEPQRYLDYPEKVINLTAFQSIKIIKHCLDKNKLFFFTSTSEIFGMNPEVPFRENSNRVLGSSSISRWCYSTSKSIVEHYLYACSFEKRLNFVGVRLFNIYGKYLKGRVVSTFLEKAIKNEDLNINLPGTQTRSFMYIDDCINIMYRILNNRKSRNKFFNIGTYNQTSVLKLAKLIKKIANSRSKIKLKKEKNKNFQDIPARSTKMIEVKKLFNYKIKFSLERGLKIYFNQLKDN